MSDPNVITLVTTWQQAVVAVALIVAVLVVPSVLSYLAARQAKRSATTVNEVNKTLTTNNGGGNVKDALDRIERSLEQQGQRQQEHGEALAGMGQRLGALEAWRRRRW